MHFYIKIIKQFNIKKKRKKKEFENTESYNQYINIFKLTNKEEVSVNNDGLEMTEGMLLRPVGGMPFELFRLIEFSMECCKLLIDG